MEIIGDLIDSAEDLVHVDDVLDREFDSQHALEMISQRGLSYLVPKRVQTSEKAQAKRLLKKGRDRYETDRKLHLGDNEWHSTTLIYTHLGELEEAGMLEVAEERDGKKIYRLTENGQHLVKAFEKQPVPGSSPRAR